MNSPVAGFNCSESESLDDSSYFFESGFHCIHLSKSFLYLQIAILPPSTINKFDIYPGTYQIESFTMQAPVKCQSIAFFSTLNLIFEVENSSIQNTAQCNSSFACHSILRRCFSALYDLVNFLFSLCSKWPFILSTVCLQTSLST